MAARKKNTIAAAHKGGEGRTSPDKVILKFFPLPFSDKKNIAADLTDAGPSALPGFDVITAIDDIANTAAASVDDVKMKNAAAMSCISHYCYDAGIEADGFSFSAIVKPESSGFRLMINSHLKEVIRFFSENLYCVVINVKAAIKKTSRCAAENVRRYSTLPDTLPYNRFFKHRKYSSAGVYL